MSKFSDTSSETGYTPEVPSPWAQDPAVREDLARVVRKGMENLPAMAAGEDPSAWIERVRAARQAERNDPVDLAAVRASRASRVRLFEPYRRLVAKKKHEPASRPLPHLPTVKGSNLDIRFYTEGDQIVIDLQARYSMGGPRPQDYENRADLELVLGLETNPAALRCPLVFDKQSFAQVRLPDTPEVRALTGYFSLWLRKEPKE